MGRKVRDITDRMRERSSSRLNDLENSTQKIVKFQRKLRDVACDLDRRLKDELEPMMQETRGITQKMRSWIILRLRKALCREVRREMVIPTWDMDITLDRNDSTSTPRHNSAHNAFLRRNAFGNLSLECQTQLQFRNHVQSVTVSIQMLRTWSALCPIGFASP